MAFTSITNYGEYISDHYLTSLLKNDLEDLRKRWSDADKAAILAGTSAADRPSNSAQGIKALGQRFFTHRDRITEQLGDDPTPEALTDPRIVEQVREVHEMVLQALAYDVPSADAAGGQAVLRSTSLDVVQLDQHRQVPVALAITGPSGLELVALEATWTDTVDGIVDTIGGCRLLAPIKLDGDEAIDHAGKAIEFLFACEDPPRYVLLLAGNVVLLADGSAWPRGYLAVNLTQALHAKDTTSGGELETVAALFGAESLITFDGQTALSSLVDKSYKHAVKVSKELREALRQSVELIAQEILDRIREHGADPDDLGDTLARRLTEQSLRYLYRILFLLYAEARPELGILPSKNEAYQQGYGLSRLADAVSYDLPEEADEGLYFDHCLRLLFTLVDKGHSPQRTTEVVLDEDGAEVALDADGIKFEALKSDLFRPDRTELIGRSVRVGQHTVDTRLRNKCLWQVLNLLVLTPEQTGRGRGRAAGQRGFISYAQLGINQLGAVYEGLMSYTGFFAPEDVYEVAKTVKVAGKSADGEDNEKADPSKGTWIVPVNQASDYDPNYFVLRANPITGELNRIIHTKGSFVYRLSGRERQRSASYYTPEVLTQCTVKHALAELLTDETTARDILDLTICEPALGSGAFLNEAINQLADAYLERAQRERGEKLLPDRLDAERQKVKAYLALHNCYGVDLNATAVELAEVSIWLNVMHEKLEAPWFGLHLRRGNSLIGARRAVYSADLLKRGAWRTTPPTDRPMACDADGQVIDRLADDEIHHFLLPAQGWGAVVEAPQAREIVPDERGALMKWRQQIRRMPSDKKTKDRLLALAQRVERLWELTRKRIAISEQEIRRNIDVWGVDPDRTLPQPASGAVSRDEVTKALYDDRESPYNRLKTVMDAWCALWFWPVGRGADIAPPTLDEWLSFCEAVLGTPPPKASRSSKRFDTGGGHDDVFGAFGAGNDFAHLAIEDEADRSLAQCTPIGRIAIDNRFEWWSVLSEIADREGFFHWELEFARVFAEGGFRLQVGNPPWVRLDWIDELALAEHDPWFALQENASTRTTNSRRAALLAEPGVAAGYLSDLGAWSGLSRHLGSEVEHPLLSGIRTNLYINFMERSWKNSSSYGIVAMIHQEQHFVDPAGGPLRAESYARLRRRFHFGNNILLFEDVDNNRSFGINVYGRPQEINFLQMARLVHPSIIEASLGHDGVGEVPSLQYPWGGWDLRPHSSRVITVTKEILADWAMFGGTNELPPNEARGLRPITADDNDAVRALGKHPKRLAMFSTSFSQGLNEKLAKEDGTMRLESDQPSSWREVILQGPHFSVAMPFAKNPNANCRSNKDYSPWDLTEMADRVIPRTNYVRACSPEQFQARQRIWGGAPATDRWRTVWRRWVVMGTERTLYATLIPPGPTHVDTVNSIVLDSNRLTAALAGVWASIPLDFSCRIAGKSNLHMDQMRQLPAPLEHPLVTPLLLRTLRLNCLTRDYAPLWEELFGDAWATDRWANSKLGRTPLAEIGSKWTMDTPLRTDYDRRLALVEVDALVALMLGLTVEQLCAMYRSQFAVLRKYEWEMFFAPDGHKIGAETHNRGVRQTEDEAAIVKAWKKAELTGASAPEISAGWVKPNREAEMTHAYHEFKRRLDAGEYPEVVEL
ncbi:type II restriction endonuclease subunit M [Micromonospora sp. 4G57]|uniref:site-specific DNA-methyltransferase (adenine-specific) n=1 Tax=Micromonospora sicca TaxID=2202420 RepID=A0ABU5JK85_9ACTN|nr:MULTISPECIES: type II restriction endonuclease subunit M [unclassified Micromonospora]MDZ5447075.1 type II restriction endonuclease subunit M [Micromonospora sp. 4G57]MDZ5493048.1 type II restriction endonuclease subunit M [Micromonospora sp. 4G53]